MKFLPKPDSLIIIFFTLFLLTIFQYIFFFNVSSNTFKEIVIEEGTNIIGDKFLFSRKDEIVKSFGSLPELENEYKNSMIEKKETNRLVQKRAIEYIIFSGIIFGAIFIVCMILMIVGQFDLSTILPKLLISMLLVVVGFSTELYLYYLEGVSNFFLSHTTETTQNYGFPFLDEELLIDEIRGQNSYFFG